MQWRLTLLLFAFGIVTADLNGQVLVEAESFAEHGSWKLDTQFIENMGSPYLIAHGLGRPVDDATTEVEFPESGEWHVYVRTKDWVAQWEAPGTPGRFELWVDDQKCDATFGTEGKEWDWQYGGTVNVAAKKAKLTLRDLTGFDGRCDAIYFSETEISPPNESEILPNWRRELLGLPADPNLADGYDIVVIGGGYAGMATAISAARMGCKVALIQNRPVLGGNGSSEVRVWAKGEIRRGKFPRIGEIVEEFCDHATKSPGTYEEFGDAKKEAIVRAEENLDLFLNHQAYDVEMVGNRILSVFAFDTRTSERRQFVAPLFTDCTGHGTIGFLAGADWDMTPKGRMGMSNMWAWANGKEQTDFPETPWALDLEMEDFPYPRDFHGQWFWEGGFDKDPITEAEAIRDWNLRAVFGAFNAMKNRGGANEHPNAYLTWVACIGGPRESRRLMGDVILTQDSVVDKFAFPDGCVPSTWSIDLHYPKKQYAKKFEDNPFISIAEHDRRVDRKYGYPVPYRCFYSRNIENLFMAGRCISVTHEALGTVRVMKTCGMMGEVVGKAASLCKLHQCMPRAIYEEHLDELTALLELPAKAYRSTVQEKITIPDDAMAIAGPYGPLTGLDPTKLEGRVIDDSSAWIVGEWTEGQGLKGYVGWGYRYAAADSNATANFSTHCKEAGKYEVRVAYQPHENRAPNAPIKITVGDKTKQVTLDQTQPTGEDGFVSLGEFVVDAQTKFVVLIGTEGAGGLVHADAVQVRPVK